MISRISKIWKSSHPRMRVRATPSTCCKTTLNFMTGRIKPRIRDQRLKTLLQLVWVKQWLWWSAAVCATAIAAPPPPAAPGTAPAPTPPAASAGAPDDDFIEFLGRDDVGDAAWWEFLKRVPPRGQKPPPAPPQDAKQ